MRLLGAGFDGFNEAAAAAAMVKRPFFHRLASPGFFR